MAAPKRAAMAHPAIERAMLLVVLVDPGNEQRGLPPHP
jgi:hypothetical protein